MDSTAEGVTLKVTIIGMLVFFLLALFVVLFFTAYQRKLLAQQKRHQQNVLKAILSGQEQEKERIAKELHDDIGAMLTTTKLYANQLTNNAASDKVLELQGNINALLTETLGSTRRISRNLRPVVLEKMGIEEGVKQLVQSLNNTGEITLTFSGEFHPDMSEEDALNIYRILQELTTNTLRHAKATQASLEVATSAETLMLNYTDNGVGFNEKEALRKNSLGLKNMTSRVSALAGVLNFLPIESGTHVRMQIPLNPQNKR